jgi:hypothetical protein
LEYFKPSEPDDVPVIGLEPSLPLTVGRNSYSATVRTLAVQLDADQLARYRKVEPVLLDLVLTC